MMKQSWKSFTSVSKRWEGKPKWWSDPKNHSPTASAESDRKKQNNEVIPNIIHQRPSWGYLGSSWGHLDTIRGLGPSWSVQVGAACVEKCLYTDRHLWGHLGLSWAFLEPWSGLHREISIRRPAPLGCIFDLTMRTSPKLHQTFVQTVPKLA